MSMDEKLDHALLEYKKLYYGSERTMVGAWSVIADHCGLDDLYFIKGWRRIMCGDYPSE